MFDRLRAYIARDLILRQIMIKSSLEAKLTYKEVELNLVRNEIRDLRRFLADRSDRTAVPTPRQVRVKHDDDTDEGGPSAA